MNSATPAVSAGLLPPTPNKLAAGPDPRDDLAHHPADFGCARIAQALAQIGSRHMENVGARNLKDVVEVVDGFDVLDHWNNQHL